MSATIEFRSTMATVHSEMTGKSTKSGGSHASEASALPFRYAASRDPTAPAVLAQFVPPCSSTNSPSAEVWHSTSPDAAPPHSADPALITRLAPSHASNAASAEANAAISKPTYASPPFETHASCDTTGVVVGEVVGVEVEDEVTLVVIVVVGVVEVVAVVVELELTLVVLVVLGLVLGLEVALLLTVVDGLVVAELVAVVVSELVIVEVRDEVTVEL